MLVILPLLFVTISDGFTLSSLQPWSFYSVKQRTTGQSSALLTSMQDQSQRRPLDCDDRLNGPVDKDQSRGTHAISTWLWRRADKAVAGAFREGPVPPDQQETGDDETSNRLQTGTDTYDLIQGIAEKKKTYFLLTGLDASGGRLKRKYFMLAGLDASKSSSGRLTASNKVVRELQKLVEDEAKENDAETVADLRIELPKLRRVENSAVAVFDFDKTLATGLSFHILLFVSSTDLCCFQWMWTLITSVKTLSTRCLEGIILCVAAHSNAMSRSDLGERGTRKDRVTMLRKLFHSLQRRGIELVVNP